MTNLTSFKKVLAAALLLGSGAAFAGNYALNHQGNQTLYNWESQVPGLPNQNNMTEEQAAAFYGCSEGEADCAIGTPVSGGAQLILKRE